MKDMNIYRGTVSRTNLVLSLVLLVFSFASISAQKVNNSATTQPASPAAGVASVQTSYADLVTRVSPAVVTIRSTERARAAQQFPFMDDPTFREFFGDRMPTNSSHHGKCRASAPE